MTDEPMTDYDANAQAHSFVTKLQEEEAEQITALAAKAIFQVSEQIVSEHKQQDKDEAVKLHADLMTIGFMTLADTIAGHLGSDDAVIAERFLADCLTTCHEKIGVQIHLVHADDLLQQMPTYGGEH